MNWYSLKNRIKYNWKRILAITLASVGTAIEAFLLIAYLFFTDPSTISILNIVNYAIVLLAYFYLLSGNIKNTNLAYRGFMLFVFFNFVDFAQALLYYVIDARASLFSEDLFYMAISIMSMILLAMGFVSGLLTYINFRRYNTFGYNTTFEKVRNWCLVFVICMVLAYGSTAAINANYMIEYESADAIDILLLVLEPISLICVSFCSFVTILRLKD